MEYNHQSIEQKWQKFWADNQTFKTSESTEKPKYYVLDMFPYPSGAGLHVGHPLGYIASDIFSRYKRLKGFNVLHPMGYDSFGLPAEQYAIQTGQHPAITTEANINRYREQLDNIGFSYDWSREVRTSEPDYYRWTQWIFMQLFDAWYNKESDKAESIAALIQNFETSGSEGIKAESDEDVLTFTADEWKAFSETEKQTELLKYRLAFLRESTVNWCPALGTVLANDEVINGLSERGGFPVEQKKMMQWSMRITAYADRLLRGLDTIDWPEPLVEMQRNWIGKSVGASVKFPVPQLNDNIEVFTTRVDTIFGVSFVVLAPEHELVSALTTDAQKAEIESYIDKTSKKSELDRLADTKTVSGAFTGSYAKHPLTGEDVQIWIADYVLAGYGTGAVMAVPSGDQRDYLFAKHFNLPIIPISDSQDISEAADPNKDGKYINSDFINGMSYQEAVPALIEKLEAIKLGKAKINFRMRDAIFGRQRYWGEPVPVYFKDGLPYLIKEEELPLLLPEVDKYLPTETGEPPLGRAEGWKYQDQYEYELSTMPGWAGSSWYWFRYMDPKNEKDFASKEAVDYWKAVDLYIGGSEHATGHLLYSRFWNKFLKDIGYHNEEEPFKKLINQGMIQGRSNFVYRVLDAEGKGTNQFVSLGLKDQYTVNPLHVDVNIVHNDVLDLEKFKQSRPDYNDAEFILENGKYICGTEVEKMSKSKFNVVNPDDIIEQYGADTLRLYEMFLGPLEQAKPWNTNGIEGVYKFLRKVWRLFHDAEGNFQVSDEEPSKAEYKALHKIIKKVEEDIERFSFNTSVSAFMICVNELTDLKTNKRKILQDLLIVLEPYAPHITEELWSKLGNEAGTISYADYPVFKPEYLVESEFAYPVSINGKMKMNLPLALDLDQQAVEGILKENADVQKLLDGKAVKKVIFVKGKIINIVV
ncbi:leucine--tRNA ligase [Sphingobacterium mizutaii NBRC 14946 = DSM 11724]|uniref:Leucine--tRNA ligase n=2 Tax=Sphingobacterium mizutaii TaxID=1010 RepID=A0AAJ4XBS7_9SPHI|nr:leucine--tRNA ligase [Sphingobacterium mizutaii]GEM67362.1 leucine--tRNA ligase [Sphingobacterium mizutaii NBRC 14946 = DSM 11724]SDL03851.1 leucyl-tRNA synthetase [Sphingobacterium mizutaii]SNV50539.1 Leucine--tRNA ligase [Sphingobacterium mizutaii]